MIGRFAHHSSLTTYVFLSVVALSTQKTQKAKIHRQFEFANARSLRSRRQQDSRWPRSSSLVPRMPYVTHLVTRAVRPVSALITELSLGGERRISPRIYYVFSARATARTRTRRVSPQPRSYISPVHDAGIAPGSARPPGRPARRFPITGTWVEPAWDISRHRSTAHRRGARRRTSPRSR